MYSTSTPPILRGRMSPVFFCGMPIADVGPVADTISPILIWPKAAVERHIAKTAARRASIGEFLPLKYSILPISVCHASAPRLVGK